MEGGWPPPAMRFFPGKDQCTHAIACSGTRLDHPPWSPPDQCRDGIDHLPKFGFGFLDLVERISQSFLRLPAILNVSGGCIPANCFSILAEEWVVANQEPAIFAALS